MSLGALAFLNPWALAALAALPVIYWLLRTVPPRPRLVRFPATRILVGIENREKTPAKTPWWLTLLRLLAAALVILALAEPVLNPKAESALKGSGPVVLVVDNGWSSAPRWSQRTSMADRIITEAESKSRPVVVVATASPAATRNVKIGAAADARAAVAALAPQPFEPDRLDAVTALENALPSGTRDASVVWLADNIEFKHEAASFAERLQRLAGTATFAVVDETSGGEALGLLGSIGGEGKLEAQVLRSGGPARSGVVHALSARGQRLAEASFGFKPGERTATAAFDLPLELRNQVARIEIPAEHSAGAVSLLDARSQWHRVGLLSGEGQELAQPLLASLYYVQKALAPFADLIRPKGANLAAGVDAVLKQNASVMVLADIGTLSGEIHDRVAAWVSKGGVLVRFAGPRLEKGGDDLLPVALRLGGRTLGGALSWSTPQPLAPFEQSSLFAGVAIPAEVTVNRQVLADPARLGADVSVWARLKDGTPLVTATRRDEGMIVLFHVTANSEWSNLPLSGLFVEMLRRITTLGRAGGVGTEASAADSGAVDAEASAATTLAPVMLLDGFGILKAPPPTARAVEASEIAQLTPALAHPPGYYGPSGKPRALNIIGPKSVLEPLPSLPPSIEHRGDHSQAATLLKPSLLAVALALLFADILAVMVLQAGGAALNRMLPRRSSPSLPAVVVATALAAAGLAATAGLSPPASAQGFEPSPRFEDGLLPGGRFNSRQRLAPGPTGAPLSPMGDVETALRATSKVTLGYVVTGDREVDETSRLGLAGLSRMLSTKTAVEPGEPMPIDIEKDEIGFYPVLYWPVSAASQALTGKTLAKIDAYMKQGGMIVFDTRDYGAGLPTGMSLQGQGTPLQRLLGNLDIPRLEPVPEGHVLTKSFYLLRSFPGRWDGGQMWVEADTNPNSAKGQGRKAQHADGVTAIVVTSNDLAAAWALDERGRPLYPTVPGGEQQREMAFRTGINIVMHALTGNYKADQVHVPALLERLGQ